jgi:predicted enzyme related to lactoylglutathione lyase
VQPCFDEAFYAGFDINDCEPGLHPDMTGIQGGNHSLVYWAVDDIESCVEKLVTAGATIADAVKEVGGGIKTAVVNDLWVNAVRLTEEA